MPNCNARSAMEMMAGRESCCPVFDDCLTMVQMMMEEEDEL